MAKKLNGTVIVTYRCNARCSMCNRYKAPSKPEEEITVETIAKLPKMNFVNVTGGENIITIPGVSDGTHEVTVTYSGDDNYTSKTVITNVTVSTSIVVPSEHVIVHPLGAS